MDVEDSFQNVNSESSSYSLNSWMRDLFLSIRHLKIGELSLASAHNAGMDNKAPYTNSYDTFQDDSFRHQLNNGIRALDLRLKWFSGYGAENIPEGFRFFHSGVTSGRKFVDLLDELDAFHAAQPREIVILDFHKLEPNSASFGVPYSLLHAYFMRRYANRMLPWTARQLTLDDIYSRYPGRNVVVAVPEEVYAGRDSAYFWRKISHQWVGSGAVDEGRLHGHLVSVLGNPPFNDVPWSMSATTYGAGGPGGVIRQLCGWYPIGGDWQRKSSIINFDFVTRESAAFIRYCIESNIGKPLRPRLAILRPSEGETVYGPRLTVAGVGRTGARLTLVAKNEEVELNWASVVRNEGNWEISVEIPPSGYDLSCRQQYDGHDSQWTVPITVQYVGVPLPPTIRSPAHGSMVGNRKPDISGRGAVSGASVEFYDTKEPPTYYGSTRADSSGNWIGTPEADLPGQEFSLRCLQRLDGMTSPFSEPVTFTFMNAPTILAPSDGSEGVSVITLIRGEGALPGATVWFFRSGDFILEYGRAVADQNGQWSGFNSKQFPLGQFSLACKQILNGVGSEPASVTFNVEMLAPKILEPSEGSTVATPRPLIIGNGALPGATVVIYKSGTSSPVYGTATAGADGAWVANTVIDLTGPQFSLSCVQQLNGATSPPSPPVTFSIGLRAPTILTPVNDSTVTTARPLISGWGAHPGAIVEFYESGNTSQRFGGATADQEGRWGAEPIRDLPGAQFSLSCLQVYEGMSSSLSTPVVFNIRQPLTPPTILTPVKNSTVPTARPTITGFGARQGAKVLFYKSGTSSPIYGEATAANNGLWSGVPYLDLTGPQFSLSCVQEYNGVRSEPSTPVTFNIGEVVLKITQPADGSDTDTINPQVKGTGGKPGATVRFFKQGALDVYGTATVDANGEWSGTAVGLAPGLFHLVCNQTLGGWQSEYSAPSTFTVLGKPPAPRDLTVVPGLLSAQVEWQNESPNIISYLYSIDADPPRTALAKKVTLDDLRPNTAYTFSVRSLRGDLKLSDSATIAFKTNSISGKIEATNFRITANANRSITFAWDPPAEMAIYLTGYLFKVFILEQETFLEMKREMTLDNLIPFVPIAVGVRCRFSDGTESDWVRLPATPQP